MRHRAGELDRLDRTLQLAACVGQRLAVLESDDRGELVLCGHELVSEGEDDLEALCHRRASPLMTGQGGRPDCFVHILDRGVRAARLHLSRCRVEDVAVATARAGESIAIDEMLNLGAHPAPS